MFNFLAPIASGVLKSAIGTAAGSTIPTLTAGVEKTMDWPSLLPTIDTPIPPPGQQENPFNRLLSGMMDGKGQPQGAAGGGGGMPIQPAPPLVFNPVPPNPIAPMPVEPMIPLLYRGMI